MCELWNDLGAELLTIPRVNVQGISKNVGKVVHFCRIVYWA